MVYVKYWPAFLIRTCELPAQKKQLLQRFRMNRASAPAVSLINVTLWHRNLLNRKYEQNLCLWEFFFCLFIERVWRVFFLSFSDMWLQKCGKGKGVAVVLQPRCALPCFVTYKALCCCRGEGWPRGAEGIWGEREEPSAAAQDRVHKAEEDGNLSERARKAVKRLACFQAFCFWMAMNESWGESSGVERKW